MQSMMLCKCGFVAVMLVDFSLPKSRACLDSRKYLGFAKRIEAIINQRDWIGIFDGKSVQLSIIETELESCVFHWGEHDR